MCPICRKGENGLCPRCEGRIHIWLDDLFEFWLGAHDQLLPSKTGTGARSSDLSIGLNVAALSFIGGQDILRLLHSWESLIRQERRLTPPALLPMPKGLSDEIRNAIKFQQSHLLWSSAQDWFADYVGEIKELHQQGMAASKSFVEKKRRIACPSENSDATGSCGNLLKINENDPLEIFSCFKCGTEWNTLRLVAVAMSDSNREVWLDAEALASWVGLSDRQVRRIIKDHNIPKRGQLYDAKKFRDAYTA